MEGSRRGGAFGTHEVQSVARELWQDSTLAGLARASWFSRRLPVEAWREGDPLQQVFWLLGKLAGIKVLAVSSGMRFHAAGVRLSLGPYPVVYSGKERPISQDEWRRWRECTHTRHLLPAGVAWNHKTNEEAPRNDAAHECGMKGVNASPSRCVGCHASNGRHARPVRVTDSRILVLGTRTSGSTSPSRTT